MNDSEFYKGVTDDQKRIIHTQGCHILTALLILEKHYIDGTCINCREFCNKVCEGSLSNHSRRTVELWFMACELNNDTSIVAKYGIHSLNHDLNHFLEIKNDESENTLRDNDDVHQELRIWVLKILKVLNLKSIDSKVI